MFSYLLIENLGCFSVLEWQYHRSINIIIGENDTGKTYLLKLLYSIAKSVEEFTKRSQSDKPDFREVLSDKLFWVYQPQSNQLGELVKKGESHLQLRVKTRLSDQNYDFSFDRNTTRQITNCLERIEIPDKRDKRSELNALFIPPKEVLTAFDAIAAIDEQLKIFGFDHTYQDLIKALRVPKSQGEIQKNLKEILNNFLPGLLTGEIQRENNQFIFQREREKYYMSQTAEGVKKIGIFTTLIQNRILRPGTILLIDEPESNLHPGAIVSLADILFEFSQAGIQIYVSTHNYLFLKKMEILARKHQKSIQLCSLKKINKISVPEISADFSDLKEGMPDNPIIDAAIKLYEQDVRLELEA